MTALYTLIGPPGAGKTSLRPCFPAAVVVSLDGLRALVSCCDMNQAADLRDEVVRSARARTARVLRRPRDVLWDATNAVAAHRVALVELAHLHGVRAVAVVVLPPLDVVLARNALRGPTPCSICGYPRRVPEDVVQRMHAAITVDLPALAGEGWDEVRVGATATCPGVPR